MEGTTDSTRTCVGCGTSEPPERFERFVWSAEAGLIHDLRRKAPGRGAHVHADRICLTKAVKSGFNRSFKAAVDAGEPDQFVEQVRTAIGARLTETMRLAARSRAAGVGSRGVDDQLKSNSALMLFIASDAGEATRKKYVANAERKNLPIVRTFDGATMGQWCGHDFVAVVTVSGRLGLSALADVESLAQLVVSGVEAGGEP